MAAVINTNISSLNAQRNLTSSQSALATSLQRLSSGLRINSAKDDAAGLAISERFSTQIRGMNVAVRNANDGISLAQTAEGALTEIGNNLQRVRELSVQSRNATNSASDRAALNAEAQQLKAEIQRVAEQTSFNDTKLLDGSFTNQAFQVGANQNQTINIAQIANANIADLGNWTRVATSSGVTGADAVASGGTTTVNGTAPTSTTTGGTTTAGGTGTIDLSSMTTNGTDGYDAFSIVVNGETVNVGAVAYATDAPTTQAALATAVASAINSEVSGVATATAGNVGWNNSATGAAALTISTTAPGGFTAVNDPGEVTTSGTTTFGTLTAGQLTINAIDIGAVTGGATATAGVDALVSAFNAAKALPANATALGNITASNENGTLRLVDSTGAQIAIAGTNPAAAGLTANPTAGTTSGATFNAGNFTLTGSKGAATINFAAAGSAAQRASNLVTAINNQSYNTGVSASLDSTGKLQLSSAEGNFSVTATGTGTTAENDAALLAATGLTAGSTDSEAATAVTSATSWAAGAAATGFADLDISTALGADNAILAMDAALTAVNSARAELGAVQNRFTSVVANLGTNSENLASSRSRILDADFAAETAAMTRGQILQQAGTAMLAQANSLPNGVLALLRG